MQFSLPEFLSDMTADGATIALDMPNGGYDRLHQFLEKKIALPEGKAGRVAIIAVLLTASRLVKQQLGHMGPIANFLNEIGEDAVREQAKRILETAGKCSLSRSAKGSPKSFLETLLEMDGPARENLLKQYRRLDADGQQHLRAQLTRSTATELAVMSGMSQDDFDTLLDIMQPQMRRTPRVLDNIAIGLFPWLKEK